MFFIYKVVQFVINLSQCFISYVYLKIQSLFQQYCFYQMDQNAPLKKSLANKRKTLNLHINRTFSYFIPTQIQIYHKLQLKHLWTVENYFDKLVSQRHYLQCLLFHFNMPFSINCLLDNIIFMNYYSSFYDIYNKYLYIM